MRGHPLAPSIVPRRQRRALMTFRRFSNLFRVSAAVLAVMGALCPAFHAQTLSAQVSPDQSLLPQGPLLGAPMPFVEAAPPVVITPSNVTLSNLSLEHKFW